MPRNTQRTGARIGWAISAAGLAAAAAMPVLGIDGMDGGFALVFGGGFLALVGLVVVATFGKRARVMDALLAGQGRVLHWHYPLEQWRAFMGEDAEETGEAMIGGLILVGVLGLGVSGALFAADPENGIWVVATMGVVLALCAVAAWSTWSGKSREAAMPGGEAMACFDGVFLGETLHTWVGLGERLEDVALEEGVLTFRYRTLSRYSTVQVEVGLPVPDGREGEAEALVQRFRAEHPHLRR